MLDNNQIDTLLAMLIDRFSAEELVEILGLSPDDIVDKFLDEILRTNWDEHL